MTSYRADKTPDPSTRNICAGAGCICHPYRPFVLILTKNIAEKKKTGTGRDVLKETAKEWLAQFSIIY